MLVCSSCEQPYGAPHKFACYVRGRYSDSEQGNVYEDVADIDTYDSAGSDDCG